MTLPVRLFIGLGVALGLLCTASNVCHGQATNFPNIVLMMADDMGLGDTSAYQDFTGNTDAEQIHTPQMERLARLGVRFTDAHTPSSRCSPTRYSLLTGRYAWRSRLKHWVLFGAQGDPMIEMDRPTIGTVLQAKGYRTGLFGKWHVGLRYRRGDGSAAAGWDDADLQQPLLDTPLDHGFEVCQFTSRSHGTSGPSSFVKKRPNRPGQAVGPGHLDGRVALAATGDGKRLNNGGTDAYVLESLGSRHCDHALAFMQQHIDQTASRNRPFFLYYPSNSNHSPYTPDSSIQGVPVAGDATNQLGERMGVREDFVYENDVALGHLLDFLYGHDDPRRPGQRLIDNTLIIFTSDNGAEKDSNVATGPFRSHKGSVYEGGHRVPFLAAWQAGGVGDGNEDSPPIDSHELIGLQDLFATFGEMVGAEMPNLRQGQRGGEDSVSVLAAMRGDPLAPRGMFFNDHSQATDPAACAFRYDNPIVQGQVVAGKWKLFFDAALLRQGIARPMPVNSMIDWGSGTCSH